MKIRLIAALLASYGVMATAADDVVQTARDIQKEKKNAVVWVEGVLKLQVSNQGETRNREQKVETLGTMIDEDGLTVVPGSALNPASMLTRMMRGSGVSMDGQLSDVKLRLEDGTEVEADVVLKDDDLDIAFLSPSSTEEGKEELPDFTYVEMQNGAEPELLDQIIMLGRMPKFMNREATVIIRRIVSIVEKPRTFYCVDNLDQMGVPAFSADGKLIGITVLRKASDFNLAAAQNRGITPVILPVEDVRDIAKQALAQIEKAASGDK